MSWDQVEEIVLACVIVVGVLAMMILWPRILQAWGF